MRAEELRWFNRWLKGYTSISVTAEEFPVRIFVMGADEWRDEREWPLARTQWTPYYLHSGGSANSRFGDGTLSTSKPEAEPTDNYQYDPAHPVPFVTDSTSSQIGGPDDYSAIERRDDVLVYMTKPLQERGRGNRTYSCRIVCFFLGSRYRFHGKASRHLAIRFCPAPL